MQRAILAFLLICVPVVLADTWWSIQVDSAGVPVAKYWNDGGPHTLGENEYPASYVFPTNEFRYWKKVGTDWVAMTTNEQAAVGDAIAEAKAETANWKTNSVDGDTLADAFRALVICINKRLPATNRITAAEFKAGLKDQLKQE